MSTEGANGRLSAAQMERYQAHVTLPGVGSHGQRRLLGSRVLVVGVGGLGCPAAQYLAAAGVGCLGLVDDDVVETTNLQRQILFGADDVGRAKVEVAAEHLRALNPDLAFETRQLRVSASNVEELVNGWDLVLDGSDNFATRYVVNDACVLGGVTLVTGSIYQYEGQVTAIRSPDTPCYRCLFPSPPPEQPACHEAGVLASLAGLVGCIQATEALEILLHREASLLGRLLLVDVQQMSFRRLQLRPDPDCGLCGSRPTILEPTAVTVGRGGREE